MSLFNVDFRHEKDRDRLVMAACCETSLLAGRHGCRQWRCSSGGFAMLLQIAGCAPQLKISPTFKPFCLQGGQHQLQVSLQCRLALRLPLRLPPCCRRPPAPMPAHRGCQRAHQAALRPKFQQATQPGDAAGRCSGEHFHTRQNGHGVGAARGRRARPAATMPDRVPRSPRAAQVWRAGAGASAAGLFSPAGRRIGSL